MLKPFRNLSLAFGITTLLVLFIGYRLGPQRLAAWYPPVPVQGEVWTAAEMPPTATISQQMGAAGMQGWQFSNLFNETVDTQFISTTNYEAYLDPVEAMGAFGYNSTAEKRLPLFGKYGSVRSILFKQDITDQRVLMYYWQQYADGTTRADTSALRHSDPFARLRIGLDTVLTATPSCLIRIYTPVHPADFKAIQARRSLNEVAHLIQAAAAAQAGNGPVLPKPTWLTSRLSADESGTDLSYLTTKLADFPAAQKQQTLLPLTKGNFWEMDSYVNAKEKHKDRLEVVGPITVDGMSGMEVRLTRDGKPWRREVYRRTENELQLVGAQDENSQLMRYSPPIPLVHYPLVEGEALPWHGSFQMAGKTTEARALSRISGRENMQTPSGLFRTLRVDTLLTLTPGNGKDIRFPTVRWLAPNVGFVRRGFVDKGRPAFSEVTRFSVH